jgi:S-adenosylmethionine hydrolase
MPKKGYKQTEEHKINALAKKNFSSPMKGKHHSKVTREKMGRHMKGRKPWNYIDGHTIKNDKYGTIWTTIRRNILIRDNFTCQNCFITNVKFDIHHKIPFLETFDNSEENLITLCESCHLEAERLKKQKGGKGI